LQAAFLFLLRFFVCLQQTMSFSFKVASSGLSTKKEDILTVTCLLALASLGLHPCLKPKNVGMGEDGQNQSLLDEITSASNKQSWLVKEFWFNVLRTRVLLALFG
jgi:hypothetical protein